jgi:hypothetical protein
VPRSQETATPIGPPGGAWHSPTVGSQEEAVSYERGTPVPAQEPKATLKPRPNEEATILKTARKAPGGKKSMAAPGTHGTEVVPGAKGELDCD